MERRIKIVWILSIIVMLLITAGQAYWIRNQYQYMTEERIQEAYNYVLQTIQQNDSIRNLQPKKIFGRTNSSFYNIDTQSNETEKHYLNNLILGSVLGRDTLKKDSLTRDKPTVQKRVILQDSFKIVTSDIMLPNLNRIIDLYKLEVDVPFTLQRFDSLLTSHLQSSPFTTQLKISADSTYQWEPVMNKTGNLLYPHLEIIYPYNPLKHQFVIVNVELTPHTLLIRMGWQLAGSFCLIALLGLCLLFQIKTILKQRRIDELRRSFVNTMIHELKRPVQALKMCVAFLNNKSMRTNEQVMDDVIRDSMSELNNLSAYLSKLRDMTRADDDQTSLTMRTFDIKEIIEKLIRLYHIPEGKEVTIHTRFSKETLITADPVHIANIVSNLIENAVKYSVSSVQITIDCNLHNHELILRVSDNGIGILASEQSRVFDKFYRGSNLHDRSLPGIGLGLSYVKLLVEAHHGTIRLESQPGKGTDIEIIIPQ